jgi:hypothetical protein
MLFLGCFKSKEERKYVEKSSYSSYLLFKYIYQLHDESHVIAILNIFLIHFLHLFTTHIHYSGDIGTLNTSHDMIKLMPKLKPQDVAEAVIFAISTPENVLVMNLSSVIQAILSTLIFIFISTLVIYF